MDPREKQDGTNKEAGPVGTLIDIPIDLSDTTRVVKIGASLGRTIMFRLIELLRTNNDVFAWSHADMCDISPKIVTHVLNIDPKFPPGR